MKLLHFVQSPPSAPGAPTGNHVPCSSCRLQPNIFHVIHSQLLSCIQAIGRPLPSSIAELEISSDPPSRFFRRIVLRLLSPVLTLSISIFHKYPSPPPPQIYTHAAVTPMLMGEAST